MKYLTSDICDGRRPGTEGNENARKYIENRFKKIGLKDYKGSFSFSFQKQIASIQNINLQVTGDNKIEYEFEYGKDYIEVFLNNEN